MEMVTGTITFGNRDGTWYSPNYFNNSGNDVATGWHPQLGRVGAFFVFSPSLPKDAKIATAYLTVVPSAANFQSVNIMIYGIKLPNSPIPTNFSDCENAPLTSGKLWSIGDVSFFVPIISTNIADQIQEIIDLGGFDEHSNIIIQLRGVPQVQAVLKNFVAFDYANFSHYSAQLRIEYIVVSGKSRIMINDRKSPLDIVQSSDILLDGITVGDRPINP